MWVPVEDERLLLKKRCDVTDRNVIGVSDYSQTNNSSLINHSERLSQCGCVAIGAGEKIKPTRKSTLKVYQISTLHINFYSFVAQFLANLESYCNTTTKLVMFKQ